MTTDIFLSYNREDQATAQRFAEAFETAGFSVWWDVTLRSGEAYDQVTEEALRAARAVVVLWSKKSVVSRWVRAEATLADRNHTLVPARIEACDLPIMFELTQTADLSRWRGDTADSAWRAFLGDVRRRLGRDEPLPAGAAPAVAMTAGDMASVAVLPVTHRKGDVEMELLADELTEEITRELAPRRFYRVIAAGRMAAWRDTAIDYRAVGRELEARYLVEGKVDRPGQDIRLTIQLIDTESANMLWSQRFFCRAGDEVALPGEFPVAVAAEISEHIVQVEMERAMTRPGPWSGWEHMLRARAYIARQGSDSTRSYIDEARRAVALAPDLGIAHAILASGLIEPVVMNGQPLDKSQIPEIQVHLKRAMQLEGDNPAVIAACVPTYEGLGEYETCLRLARRAVELYPASPMAHFTLGRSLLSLGRTGEAIAAFRHQDSLAAFDATRVLGLAMLGIACLLEGQPAEAEEALDRSLALYPDSHLALKWKAVVAARRGRREVAAAAIRRLREVEPAITLEHHVQQMTRNPNLAEHMSGPVTVLRELWRQMPVDEEVR